MKVDHKKSANRIGAGDDFATSLVSQVSRAAYPVDLSANCREQLIRLICRRLIDEHRKIPAEDCDCEACESIRILYPDLFEKNSSRQANSPDLIING